MRSYILISNEKILRSVIVPSTSKRTGKLATLPLLMAGYTDETLKGQVEKTIKHIHARQNFSCTCL